MIFGNRIDDHRVRIPRGRDVVGLEPSPEHADDLGKGLFQDVKGVGGGVETGKWTTIS
jgi:hypothetical protein